MSIASEISRILSAKASLKTAINNKGGNITTEKIDQFASKVTALPSPKEEETKTLTPNFSSGNQVITPTSGKVLSQVTLTKPTDLLPENIKKDVNIFGIVGTYQISLPTLYAPTISISGDTLTITPNSNNGAFVTGYKIYVDDVLLDTATSTTYDLSEELTEVGTYEIYVIAYATGFTDSEPSNAEEYVVEPEPSSYTLTLGTINYNTANGGQFRIKVNIPPSNLGDYTARQIRTDSFWTNSNSATLSVINDVTTIYLFIAFPDTNEKYYYQINNGSWVEHTGIGYANPSVITLTESSTINIKTEPVGKTVTLNFDSSSFKLYNYNDRIDLVQYMINSSDNWINIEYPFSNVVLSDVTSIKFKLKVADYYSSDHIYIGTTPDGDDVFVGDNTLSESDTINITENSTLYFSYYDD